MRESGLEVGIKFEALYSDSYSRFSIRGSLFELLYSKFSLFKTANKLSKVPAAALSKFSIERISAITCRQHWPQLAANHISIMADCLAADRWFSHPANFGYRLCVHHESEPRLPNSFGELDEALSDVLSIECICLFKLWKIIRFNAALVKH